MVTVLLTDEIQGVVYIVGPGVLHYLQDSLITHLVSERLIARLTAML